MQTIPLGRDLYNSQTLYRSGYHSNLGRSTQYNSGAYGSSYSGYRSSGSSPYQSRKGQSRIEYYPIERSAIEYE